MNLEDIFQRIKIGDPLTPEELLTLIVQLIRSNAAFQMIFTPKTQTLFATLQLTITINPKMSTAVIITLTNGEK